MVEIVLLASCIFMGLLLLPLMKLIRSVKLCAQRVNIMSVELERVKKDLERVKKDINNHVVRRDWEKYD